MLRKKGVTHMRIMPESQPGERVAITISERSPKYSPEVAAALADLRQNEVEIRSGNVSPATVLCWTFAADFLSERGIIVCFSPFDDRPETRVGLVPPPRCPACHDGTRLPSSLPG